MGEDAKLDEIRGSVSLVILDVGGVLRDSAMAVHEGYKLGLEREGIALSATPDQIRALGSLGKYDSRVNLSLALIAASRAGQDVGELLGSDNAEAKVDELVGRATGFADRKAAERVTAVYNEFRSSEGARELVHLIPNAKAGVDRLFASGYIVGIFTNARRATVDNDLGELGLDRFCMILTEEDVQCKKPDGEGIKRIVQQQALQPNEAMYIGDGQVDILAARDAGCYSCVVLSGGGTKGRLEALSPDLIFGDLFEASGALSKK